MGALGKLSTAIFATSVGATLIGATAPVVAGGAAASTTAAAAGSTAAAGAGAGTATLTFTSVEGLAAISDKLALAAGHFVSSGLSTTMAEVTAPVVLSSKLFADCGMARV